MALEIMTLNQTNMIIENEDTFLQELSELLNFEEDTEISLVLCLDNFIKDLNTQFRNKNTPTDVLSFPSGMPFILGDIIISVETAKKQAQESLSHEIEMLLCHGFLHLLGYDHEKSDEDYTIMMDLQNLLLKQKKTEINIYES